MNPRQSGLFRALGATAFTVLLGMGVVGCGSGSSPRELPTVSESVERDAYLTALLEGELQSTTVGEKVYFTITDEFDQTWGLVLPYGSMASADGEAVRFQGQERARVGDMVSSGGGVILEGTEDPTNEEALNVWNPEIEIHGLWSSSGVEKLPIQ